ncbi:MAG: glycoside hydrolase family 88 protein [Tannerella sp.]|jgi:hypothetical protein|nr:glycoside hydrolase family 88 protein [Tannerella sp.]
MKKNLIAICLVLLSTAVYATDRTPLDVVQSIGDKLIRTTPFKNRLVVAPNRETFNHLKFVDFGRTFGLGKPGIAYALTTVYASENTELDIQLDHNDRCLIWLNGAEVYQKEHPKNLKLAHEERSIELSEKLTLSLKKGYNTLLVQSETTGTSWLFYIQPEPDKGAVEHSLKPDVQITLEGLPLIDAQVTKLTSWLVCGPFEAPIDHFKLLLSEWGEMYTSGITTSWTIPKIEILGDVIDPAPWGTNYNWNYHNGGVAWAMQVLAEVSGKETYARYASGFCNFHLKNKLFIQYQVDQLNAFQCANHHIYATPLLDFTLAPSLPFIYRLNQESSFPMRNQYEAFVNRMIDYGKNKQARLPGANIYTRLTPEVYTTWVDDMFMGIPFLAQASLYTGDKHYIQDAASQILEFNKQVWDSEAQLFMGSPTLCKASTI